MAPRGSSWPGGRISSPGPTNSAACSTGPSSSAAGAAGPVTERSSRAKKAEGSRSRSDTRGVLSTGPRKVAKTPGIGVPTPNIARSLRVEMTTSATPSASVPNISRRRCFSFRKTRETSCSMMPP
ncbi:MAG: hypothetical protein LKM31_02980 [Sphingobium sp.]|nr:hypothetical protein [Sphingobium sp.]